MKSVRGCLSKLDSAILQYPLKLPDCGSAPLYLSHGKLSIISNSAKLSHWRLHSPLQHPLRTCGYSHVYLPLCKGKYILISRQYQMTYLHTGSES